MFKNEEYSSFLIYRLFPNCKLFFIHQYSQSYLPPEDLPHMKKNYVQIEKETLSIVFGTDRVHEYLYGHHFTNSAILLEASKV